MTLGPQEMRTPSAVVTMCLVVLHASVHAAGPTWSITSGTFLSPNGRYQVSVLPSGTTNALYPPIAIVLKEGKTGTEVWRRANKVCLAGFLVRNNGTVWVDDWDYIYGMDEPRHPHGGRDQTTNLVFEQRRGLPSPFTSPSATTGRRAEEEGFSRSPSSLSRHR